MTAVDYEQVARTLATQVLRCQPRDWQPFPIDPRVHRCAIHQGERFTATCPVHRALEALA